MSPIYRNLPTTTQALQKDKKVQHRRTSTCSWAKMLLLQLDSQNACKMQVKKS